MKDECTLGTFFSKSDADLISSSLNLVGRIFLTTIQYTLSFAQAGLGGGTRLLARGYGELGVDNVPHACVTTR